MCHFHQKMIIQRYVTRRPKLEASKDLKKIVSRLTSTTQIRFENKLDIWYQEYESEIKKEIDYQHIKVSDSRFIY